MMRYTLISAVILFLVQCDKFVIDPVHSNPFDELNDNTFGNPFNMWKKNYPDKIQLGSLGIYFTYVFVAISLPSMANHANDLL